VLRQCLTDSLLFFDWPQHELTILNPGETEFGRVGDLIDRVGRSRALAKQRLRAIPETQMGSEAKFPFSLIIAIGFPWLSDILGQCAQKRADSLRDLRSHLATCISQPASRIPCLFVHWMECDQTVMAGSAPPRVLALLHGRCNTRREFSLGYPDDPRHPCHTSRPTVCRSSPK